jgi:hypothetical protein
VAEGEHGSWSPLTVEQLAGVMVGAPFRWWIAGGHALALHLGSDWRDHEDIDLGIRRRDVPALFAHLREWVPFVAASGVLRAWRGEPLLEQRSENNVWWRARADGPWVLDTSIGEGDEDLWVYRRDPRITRPWDEAVLRSEEGVPYLAPELQLLFKSKAVRPKDQADAEAVIPRLDPQRRSDLRRLLPPDHAWQELLR